MDNSREYHIESSGVPIVGISRHRLGVDGEGVTTLVAFHGCNLRCKYCLNPASLGSTEGLERYTPESLYEKVKIDDLYFRSTGGGITFGGGEPCLQADFIVGFRELCGNNWKINIETSLNVDRHLVEKLAPVVDKWIIDTKAERSVAYKEYTGVYRQRFMDNVWHLLSKERLNIPQRKVTFRVPIIPGYVSEEQARESAEGFRETFRLADVDLFRYVEHPTAPVSNGREKCELLKNIRREIAERIGCHLSEEDCNHQGECASTCPKCDFELSNLGAQVSHSDRNLQISDDLQDRVDSFNEPNPNKEIILQGDVIYPLEGQVVNYPYEEVYSKHFFKECVLAGLSFHLEKDDELWDELEVGTKLALIRHKDNKYDRNAVAVALADDFDGDTENFDFDFILGYIPRTCNAELAAMMDAGYTDKFSAEISTYNRYGKYDERIRLTIFIESAEPEIVRPDLLRAESLSLSELRNLVEELNERGTAYFRFGGFPSHQFQLPDIGEKIVMVHRDETDDILFLLRVLVTGDDCEKFVDDPDSIHCIDDCAPFILTNVMGPVRIKKSDWAFLEGIDLKSFSATEYLPPKLTYGFRGIFKSQLQNTLHRDNIDMNPSIDEL